MTRNVETNPSVQVMPATRGRSWFKFSGHQRGRLAGLFAAVVACLFAGIGTQASAQTIQFYAMYPLSAPAGADAGSTTPVELHLTGVTPTCSPQVKFGNTTLTAIWPVNGGCNPGSNNNFTVTLTGSVIYNNLQNAGGNIALIPVTLAGSAPLYFTITGPGTDPLSVQNATVSPGTSSTVQSTTAATPGAGVSATLMVSGSATFGEAISVSTYTTSPVEPGTIFQIGDGLFFDLLAPTAGDGDSITATFYYPDTIFDVTAGPQNESNLKLQYFAPDGTLVFVKTSGGVDPVQDTTDSAPIGGSFTVTFDTTTSDPKITGLGGTIFTLAPAPLPASPSTLWPPDHTMVPVTVNAPGCSILSVSSNEPQTGLGNGDVGPDWQVTGALTVNLRAERGNTKGGRIYTILLQCSDGSQNIAVVRAPHDKGKN